MKNSTSSTRIPCDTNTLAGQWMTFSHMANHYRKLLNVKPRVDTGLMPGNGIYNNFTANSAVMMQSSKSQKKMGSACTKKRQTLSSNTNANANSIQLYQKQTKKNGLLFSSHPDHLDESGKDTFKGITSNKSLLKSSNKHNAASQQQFADYQVVFGSSSIRSSTDAFMSDETESTMSNDNKPPSEIQAPIGVTEKIRRFLNHIHQLDLTSNSTSSIKKKGKTKGVTTPTNATSISNGVTVTGRKSSCGAVTIPSSNNVESRLSRHSKCFLPWEPPAIPQSPRKSPRLTTKSSSLRSKKEKQATSSSISSLNRKQGKTKLLGETQQTTNCDLMSFQSLGLARNKHTGSGMDIHSMLPEKDGTEKKFGKSRRRAGSIASIGTICGSDELTPEDFPISIRDICSTLEGGLTGDDLNDLLLGRIMDDNRYPSKHKKSSHEYHYNEQQYSHHRVPTGGSVIKSNSMASLVPSGSGCGSSSNHNRIKAKGSNGGVGNGGAANGNSNNKDSSRDSAYGFSSGESRITTRESTPEKKCLNGMVDRSHKHQHQHHRDREYERDIELQHKPCKDMQDEELRASLSRENHLSSRGSNKGIKEHRQSRSSRRDDGLGSKSASASSQALRKQNSSETYIALLAELTQDIVSKGIYTNKGLKTVFKSYLDQHKDLNQDKLADMLERLRMDLGIPKDDALDRIEFGYGSISNATSTTFFYKPPTLPDKLSTDAIISNAKSSSSANKSAPAPPDSLQSDSPSPTTIVPGTIPEAVTPAPTMTTTTTGFFSSGGPNTSSNRSTTTTKGSGDIPSDNENYKEHHDRDEEDIDLGVERDAEDDELSLSETEVTQALRIAGLDDGTMEELVGILKS